jgi:hypothetical protein
MQADQVRARLAQGLGKLERLDLSHHVINKLVDAVILHEMRIDQFKIVQGHAALRRKCDAKKQPFCLI